MLLITVAIQDLLRERLPQFDLQCGISLQLAEVVKLGTPNCFNLKARRMRAQLQYVIGAENPYNYRLQGLHPVHLGDSFASGRYEVVQKLGDGRSSMCWLLV